MLKHDLDQSVKLINYAIVGLFNFVSEMKGVIWLAISGPLTPLHHANSRNVQIFRRGSTANITTALKHELSTPGPIVTVGDL